MAVANLSSGASIAQVTPRVTRGITQGMLNSASGMIQPQSSASRSSIAQYQFPGDLPKYYFTLGVSAYTRTSALSFAVNATSTIKLPIPKQLVDNDQVAYEQQELGQIGGALSGLAGSDNLAGAMNNILGAAGAAGAATAQAGIKALSGAFGINGEGAIQSAFGIAPNPYTTVLLKGPTYKKHEFSWTLSPRTEKESEKIKEIIRLLKNSMFVGLGPGGTFFTPPKIFSPKFFKNQNYLYKFKPCVLENMSVNYTPSGAPAFYSTSGAPDAVELRLSFLEMEFWFKDQW